MQILHNNISQKFIILFSVILLLLAVAIPVKASEVESDEVEELAAALEFIYTESVLFDKNGKFISLDFEKIEEQYGKIPDIELVEKSLVPVLKPGNSGIGLMTAAVDRCVNKKIVANFGGQFLTVSLITTVIEFVKDEEWTKAAKALVKAGVKGNAVGIAATLTYIYFSCLYSEEGWI